MQWFHNQNDICLVTNNGYRIKIFLQNQDIVNDKSDGQDGTWRLETKQWINGQHGFPELNIVLSVSDPCCSLIHFCTQSSHIWGSKQWHPFPLIEYFSLQFWRITVTKVTPQEETFGAVSQYFILRKIYPDMPHCCHGCKVSIPLNRQQYKQ